MCMSARYYLLANLVKQTVFAAREYNQRVFVLRQGWEDTYGVEDLQDCPQGPSVVSGRKCMIRAQFGGSQPSLLGRMGVVRAVRFSLFGVPLVISPNFYFILEMRQSCYPYIMGPYARISVYWYWAKSGPFWLA